MPAAPIRILVVDDHPVVRGGLVAVLRTIADLEVVGEAADGEAAVQATVEHRPDVVLMDVRMPGMDGIEATRQIRAQAPESRVLVLTMYDDDATVFTAMQAGAQGYLLKESDQTDIVRAVRGVVAGEAIFGPGVATRILGYFADPPAQPASDEYPFPELTERERLVLDLLAQGRRTADIAAELYLSPKTVSNHLTTIFAKLQVAGRGEAIVAARERGLGTSP
ncbi:MAG: response regulator transcription factor [Acidimicrobiales bacterium]|nr:response regulator transcription factor [Acidimicrobiales bacterium]